MSEYNTQASLLQSPGWRNSVWDLLSVKRQGIRWEVSRFNCLFSCRGLTIQRGRKGGSETFTGHNMQCQNVCVYSPIGRTPTVSNYPSAKKLQVAVWRYCYCDRSFTDGLFIDRNGSTHLWVIDAIDLNWSLPWFHVRIKLPTMLPHIQHPTHPRCLLLCLRLGWVVLLAPLVFQSPARVNVRREWRG